jgi:hypothetical protein
MTIIHVPRPPQSAMDPDRPASSLLRTQAEHLQHAERRLPLRYRSKIYVKAIKTEGEAARYIREVTEAIHAAHADAAAQRARRAPKRKAGLQIAAAGERPGKKRKSSGKARKTSGKSGRKK